MSLPEGSFNFFSGIASRPQSMCEENSFDFSHELKALNLEVVDIEDSDDGRTSNETVDCRSLKNKIMMLLVKSGASIRP